MDWIVPQGYDGSPIVYMLIACTAFMLTGISKGGFGGVAVIATPLMMLVAPGKLALGIWVPLLILCDIFTMRAYPKEWALRPIAILAPWMLVGFGVGYVVLGRVDDRMIKIFVGVLSLVFVALQIVRIVWQRREARANGGTVEKPPWRPTFLQAAPYGIVGGVCSMVAHSAGAITTMYLLPQLDRRSFAGTSARFYFVFNIVKTPLYAQPDIGVVTTEALVKSLWLMPFVPLSIWIGERLNKHLSPETFNQVIYALLAVSGVYLLYANI